MLEMIDRCEQYLLEAVIGALIDFLKLAMQNVSVAIADADAECIHISPPV